MRAGIIERSEAPAPTPRHRSAEERPSALAFDDELGGRRERIGWARGIIASLVVALATGLVIAASTYIVRSVETVTPAAAPATESAAAVAPTEAPPAPVAPTEAAPAPPAAVVPPPAPTAAPVQASGRVADGDRTMSFIVSVAELHAGAKVSITVSATGPDTDRVQRIEITTADGVSLSSGSADACTGPAFPWSQAFTIAFPQAESTELRVKLTSCTGKVLTATSLVDIQP